MRAISLIAIAHAVVCAKPIVDPKIKHLIVMLMENHSFDNMLGWLTRNNSAINGLKGTEYNLLDPQDPTSTKYFVSDKGAYRDPDPDHSVEGTTLQLYGRQDIGPFEHNQSALTMGGFVKSYGTGHAGISIMDCMNPEHVPVISTLAMNFALFDNYFAAIPGPTFPNRAFAMSATSHGFGSNDVGETFAGWPEMTMFDKLNGTGNDYRVYFTDAATTWLFESMRTEAALERHRSIDEFVNDTAKGDLPALTWIDPGYFVANTDQHPDHDVADGERVMKMVYGEHSATRRAAQTYQDAVIRFCSPRRISQPADALRASPIWNESALVITYDEHGEDIWVVTCTNSCLYPSTTSLPFIAGGFYDSVPPPVTGVPNPDGLPCNDCKVPFNFTRLGVRIPFIVASPWVQKGVVVNAPAPEHQPSPTSQYELSSIPATVAKMFGVTTGPLTKRDAWAVPFDHIWTESGLTEPRTDCPLTMPVPPAGTPAFVGRVRDGSTRVNHLQKDLLRIVHGMTHIAKTAVESEAVLAKEGIVDELTADTYLKKLLDTHFAEHGLKSATTSISVGGPRQSVVE